jgi:hypothetical protein
MDGHNSFAELQIENPTYARMVAQINKITPEKLEEIDASKTDDQVSRIPAEHSFYAYKEKVTHQTEFCTLLLFREDGGAYTIEYHWTYCPTCKAVRSRSVVGLHNNPSEAYIWDILKSHKDE